MVDVCETSLPGVLTIAPKRFGDSRGFFSETYNKQALAEAGVDLDFVQDNHSLSAEQGTVRGLHYQAPPMAQDKLIRVVAGAILDVVVDIRKSSQTFGRHLTVELTADNGIQLLAPKGFLHGFITLTPDTQVIYKVTNYYSGEHDGAVRWNDPALGIDWGVAEGSAHLSDKDAKAPSWEDFKSPF